MCVPFPHKTHTTLNEKYVARAGEVNGVHYIRGLCSDDHYQKHGEKSGAAMAAPAYPVLSPMYVAKLARFSLKIAFLQHKLLPAKLQQSTWKFSVLEC